MRWEDEKFIKVYTRDSTDWLQLTWQAQGLFMLLLRKVDRAGVLELGKQGLKGVSSHIGGPAAWRELERPMDELISDGCVVVRNGLLAIPNFVVAQDAKNTCRQPRPPSSSSVVYAVRRGDGPVKIGWTKNLDTRLSTLQTASAELLDLIWSSPGGRDDEAALHSFFSPFRIRSEWFEQDVATLIALSKETLMPRIRTVKPEWLDDELALCSPAARVVSIALILLADDHGRGRGNEQILASRIFPSDPGIFASALGELATLGFVHLYEVDGRRYYEIQNWRKHQRVDKPGKPLYPEPYRDVAAGDEKIREDSRSAPKSSCPDQGSRTRDQGPGDVGAGAPTPSPQEPTSDADSQPPGATEPPAVARKPFPPTDAAAEPVQGDTAAPAKRKRKGKAAPPGYQEFIAAFDALFERARGAKPAWGAKQGKLVKALLKRGSLEEAVARAERMFAMAPKWPAENPDLQTLAGHWDKFAPPVKRGGHARASEDPGEFDPNQETKL